MPQLEEVIIGSEFEENLDGLGLKSVNIGVYHEPPEIFLPSLIGVSIGFEDIIYSGDSLFMFGGL